MTGPEQYPHYWFDPREGSDGALWRTEKLTDGGTLSISRGSEELERPIVRHGHVYVRHTGGIITGGVGVDKQGGEQFALFYVSSDESTLDSKTFVAVDGKGFITHAAGITFVDDRYVTLGYYVEKQRFFGDPFNDDDGAVMRPLYAKDTTGYSHFVPTNRSVRDATLQLTHWAKLLHIKGERVVHVYNTGLQRIDGLHIDRPVPVEDFIHMATGNHDYADAHESLAHLLVHIRGIWMGEYSEFM